MTFDQLELNPELLKGIEEKGYKKATPIQAKAIPAVLEGKDLLGGAQTGTGKTAAFALPILDILSKKISDSKAPKALILAPTRELTDQVAESFKAYGKHLSLETTKIFGGVKMSPQITNLENGTDIIVATPGRLMDHLKQKTVDLSNIKILVLDEADRMLDMGFVNDIKEIIEALPYKRQNLLFSATYGSDIEELAKDLLSDPVSIEVTKRNTAAVEVKQIVNFVDKGDRYDLLEHLITEGSWYQVLIFVKTKHGADRLNSQLLKSGIPSSAIHGDKSQGARNRALQKFKSGDLQALVATDVAARGIDLHDLSHVVNFELPQIPEDYIHRIGRTGRAGKSGVAISLVSFTEKTQLKKIEKILKYTIPQSVVEGFEPKHDINKDLNKDKSKDKMKEKIQDNKRSRGLKQKTSRTPRPSARGSESNRNSEENKNKRNGKPRFKSTRTDDNHGGQTFSNKRGYKSSKSEDDRRGGSRSGKPGSRPSRSEDSRGRDSRPGKPGFKSSRSEDSRGRDSRPGKRGFKSSRSEDSRGRDSRPGKPGFKSSRSEDSRGRDSRPGKPGFKSSRSEDSRSGNSRPGKPGFKSSGSKSTGKRNPQSGKTGFQSKKSRRNDKSFFHK